MHEKTFSWLPLSAAPYILSIGLFLYAFAVRNTAEERSQPPSAMPTHPLNLGRNYGTGSPIGLATCRNIFENQTICTNNHSITDSHTLDNHHIRSDIAIGAN